jgi:hypothetical protein
MFGRWFWFINFGHKKSPPPVKARQSMDGCVPLRPIGRRGFSYRLLNSERGRSRSVVRERERENITRGSAVPRTRSRGAVDAGQSSRCMRGKRNERLCNVSRERRARRCTTRPAQPHRHARQCESCSRCRRDPGLTDIRGRTSGGGRQPQKGTEQDGRQGTQTRHSNQASECCRDRNAKGNRARRFEIKKATIY